MAKKILLADDQVPHSHLQTRDAIRDFYKHKFGDPGFAEGFVFLFDLLTELRDNAYQVTAVNSTKAIDAALETGEFDGIILDLGWWTELTTPYEERMSKGWEIAEKLKKSSSAPIIMFSNRFPDKNNLAEVAATNGLLPVFKSYDANCIKSLLVTLKYMMTAKPVVQLGRTVFLGHGHSQLWLQLKEFLENSLHLKWEEFNRVPVAGITTVDRLKNMLDSAGFALLVMTAEDVHGDRAVYARENVVHEIGLFQGRLGFNKAIVLLEQGCESFSNISGLTCIPFRPGKIRESFRYVRGVLQREGVLD